MDNYPNTASGNRTFVRTLLKQNQPRRARVLDLAVRRINGQHKESCWHYSPDREMQDWMNELRGCLPRPAGAPSAEDVIRKLRDEEAS
jgi:hypothetical protein